MKKKLLTAILLAIFVFGFTACNSSEEASSSNTPSGEETVTEETETEETEETEEETATEEAEEVSVDEKLLSLWRLDLPEAAKNQTVHDDTVNNAVTYFPNAFSFLETEKNNSTIIYENAEDDAILTISVNPNTNGFTIEEFAKNTVNNEDGMECEVKYTGTHAFKATGTYPEDKRCVQLIGVVKDGKLFTVKTTYPENLAEKYALAENEIFILVNGLDKNGNVIDYSGK